MGFFVNRKLGLFENFESLGLEWARCLSNSCPEPTEENEYNSGSGALECQISKWDDSLDYDEAQTMSCVSRRDGTCPGTLQFTVYIE